MEGLLTYEKYLEKVKVLNSPYWNRSYQIRWAYTEPVISEIKKIQPKTAIEIGTMQISMLAFSATMDLEQERVDPENLKNPMYIGDSRITPWNIADKQYDLFLGLQVLEHLGPNQVDVFKEIRRISKRAILTLPYMWNCPEDPEHHMITDAKILEWTCDTVPYKREEFNKRIMLCYEF